MVHTEIKLYNFKKMATSFKVEAMIQGYHEYKDIWEAEVGNKLQYQRKTGNPYEVYAPTMQPASLLATMMVLTALKGKLLPLPFLKFFNKDILSSRVY